MAERTLAADVRLRIGGFDHHGWESVHVERGIEQIAGSFSLTLSDQWPGLAARRPVRPGDACEVLIDGEPVITGYVDTVAPRESAGEHAVTVSGRDKTGDLVDCSAPPAQWKGLSLRVIAGKLCAPFGVRVLSDVPAVDELFPSVRTSGGTPVFEVLEGLARQRAVLLVSDGLGSLVMTQASEERIATALQRGVNVISAEAEISWLERFGEYTVARQMTEDLSHWGASAQQGMAVAQDPGVMRHRPLRIEAEEGADAKSLQLRAAWERDVRLGRSTRLNVTVHGWRHAEGLWQPNKLVRLQHEALGADGWFLTAHVAYTLDAQGTRTVLMLYPREAFTRIPLSDEEKVRPLPEVPIPR